MRAGDPGHLADGGVAVGLLPEEVGVDEADAEVAWLVREAEKAADAAREAAEAYGEAQLAAERVAVHASSRVVGHGRQGSALAGAVHQERAPVGGQKRALEESERDQWDRLLEEHKRAKRG